jgi:hypothetical protein
MNQTSTPSEKTDAHAAALCKNCGENLAGNYCHHCGQRAMTPHDYSFLSFLQHAIHDITHFDSKIFRSIVPLLFKPGFLTAEYLLGRQARFIKPVTMFVLANLAFFLIGYRMGLLNWTMQGVVSGPHSGLAKKLVAEKIRAAKTSEEEFAAHFKEVLKNNQKSMFFFLIPLFGLALKLVYLRSKRYYVEHLIFSIHYHSFLLVYMMAGLPLLIIVAQLIDKVLGTAIQPFINQDPGILLPIIAGLFTYMFAAVKRVYGQSAIIVAMKTVILVLGQMGMIAFIIRPIMFFITYFSL